jgi:hypothetical protein
MYKLINLWIPSGQMRILRRMTMRFWSLKSLQTKMKPYRQVKEMLSKRKILLTIN